MSLPVLRNATAGTTADDVLVLLSLLLCNVQVPMICWRFSRLPCPLLSKTNIHFQRRQRTMSNRTASPIRTRRAVLASLDPEVAIMLS